MLIGALTGGIACGKSLAARYFADLGVHVVDADQVAREVVEPGQPAYHQIVERFDALTPKGIRNPDGSLNRKALGALVFADAALRKELEAITHPRILTHLLQRLQERRDCPYALYEAALVIENGSYKMFPFTIVVTASPQVQLARVMQRDGLRADEARARIAAQMPNETKVALANYVLCNNGDHVALQKAVQRLHVELLLRSS